MANMTNITQINLTGITDLDNLAPTLYNFSGGFIGIGMLILFNAIIFYVVTSERAFDRDTATSLLVSSYLTMLFGAILFKFGWLTELEIRFFLIFVLEFFVSLGWVAFQIKRGFKS
jgi:cytochrome bd-type quinol oxidase subunit 1